MRFSGNFQRLHIFGISFMYRVIIYNIILVTYVEFNIFNIIIHLLGLLKSNKYCTTFQTVYCTVYIVQIMNYIFSIYLVKLRVILHEIKFCIRNPYVIIDIIRVLRNVLKLSRREMNPSYVTYNSEQFIQNLIFTKTLAILRLIKNTYNDKCLYKIYTLQIHCLAITS